MKTGSKSCLSGFTLMEVLVVLGIIAILATTAIVAINPARQFAHARNVQRIANIHAILNAVQERMADNNGIFEGGGCPRLSTASTSIDDGSGGSGADFATNCLVPTYIPTLPQDPASQTSPSTGYQTRIDSLGRVMICAPLASAETALTGTVADTVANNPPVPCVVR